MFDADFNTINIKTLHSILQALDIDIVFVGGATISLYVTGSAAEEVRPTKDVDVLVALAGYNDYAALEVDLRELGFQNDQESGVICRYTIDDLIVDIMPTLDTILGFSNKWYPEGFLNAMTVDIDDVTVKIFSAPYFIAAKLEAFKSRGENDGRTSTDFEDIVYILNNRPGIWAEFEVAPETVRQYLIAVFTDMFHYPYFHEWVYGHLEYGFADEQAKAIMESIKKFIS